MLWHEHVGYHFPNDDITGNPQLCEKLLYDIIQGLDKKWSERPDIQYILQEVYNILIKASNNGRFTKQTFLNGGYLIITYFQDQRYNHNQTSSVHTGLYDGPVAMSSTMSHHHSSATTATLSINETSSHQLPSNGGANNNNNDNRINPPRGFYNGTDNSDQFSFARNNGAKFETPTSNGYSGGWLKHDLVNEDYSDVKDESKSAPSEYPKAIPHNLREQDLVQHNGGLSSDWNGSQTNSVSDASFAKMEKRVKEHMDHWNNAKEVESSPGMSSDNFGGNKNKRKNSDVLTSLRNKSELEIIISHNMFWIFLWIFLQLPSLAGIIVYVEENNAACLLNSDSFLGADTWLLIQCTCDCIITTVYLGFILIFGVDNSFRNFLRQESLSYIFFFFSNFFMFIWYILGWAVYSDNSECRGRALGDMILAILILHTVWILLFLPRFFMRPSHVENDKYLTDSQTSSVRIPNTAATIGVISGTKKGTRFSFGKRDEQKYGTL